MLKSYIHLTINTSNFQLKHVKLSFSIQIYNLIFVFDTQWNFLLISKRNISIFFNVQTVTWTAMNGCKLSCLLFIFPWSVLFWNFLWHHNKKSHWPIMEKMCIFLFILIFLSLYTFCLLIILNSTPTSILLESFIEPLRWPPPILYQFCI